MRYNRTSIRNVLTAGRSILQTVVSMLVPSTGTASGATP